ncbi:MAG: calcium-binding protein [Pseudomonadota bacterium]
MTTANLTRSRDTEFFLGDHFSFKDQIWESDDPAKLTDDGSRNGFVVQYDDEMEETSLEKTNGVVFETSEEDSDPSNSDSDLNPSFVDYRSPPPADHSWAAKGTLLDWFGARPIGVDIVSNGELQLGNGVTNFNNELTGAGFEKFGYTKIVGNDGDNVITGMGTYEYSPPWGSEVPYRYDFDDLIYGGAGNDVIYGLEGNDRLFGEDDNDVLHGGKGNDYLDGGEGNDILFGGEGYDVLVGGEGNDWLYSGPTNGPGQGAEMYGGAGADTFVLGDTWNPPQQEEEKPSWNPHDLVNSIVSLGSTFVPHLKLATAMPNLVRTISDAFGTNKDSGSMGQAAPSITKIKDFNPLEDKIMLPVSDPASLSFYLSEDSNPNVVLTIKDASGQVFAEISFARPQDVFGPETTSWSNEFIELFVKQMTAGAMIIGKDGVFLGMEDKKSLDVDPRVLEELGANNFLLLGAYGGQEFYGKGTADTVVGTNYNDVLSAYNLDDSTPGNIDHYHAHNDILYGYGGDDLFFGGAGHNSFHGGADNDTASYEYANRGIIADMADVKQAGYYKVVNGHAYGETQNNPDGIVGTDKLYSIENIIGGDYNDIIYGDDNDNIFVSGGGDDELAGRGGADTFVLTGGKNKILDFNAKEGDKIQVSMEAYGLTDGEFPELDLVAYNGGTQLVNKANNNVIVKLEGVDPKQFDIYSNVELLDPSGKAYKFHVGTEEFHASVTDDHLIYATGNNHQTVWGKKGDDILIASGENKVLQGGQGDDVLIFGEHGVKAYGGLGADAFIFTGGSGATPLYDAATIKDFDASQGDSIYIDFAAYGIESVKDLSINEVSGDGKVLIWGGEQIIGWVENSDSRSIRDSIKDVSESDHGWLL